jgi:hypothetical protein
MQGNPKHGRAFSPARGAAPRGARRGA